MPNPSRTAKEVDILLLLEGTYPYVSGGVSSWVHQLICSFPNYQFGAIFLGGQRKDYKGLKYDLPNNLIHLEEHYLFEQDQNEKNKAILATHPNPDHFQSLTCIHSEFSSFENKNFQTITKTILSQLDKPDAITMDDFLHSHLSWSYITEKYQTKCPHTSFIDYFWSIRNMHLSLWKIFNIIKQAPKALCLHSVSTGYAGLLGALLSQKQDVPYIVSEHGIYIRERKIDLMRQQWFQPSYFINVKEQESKKYITQLWIRFFELLGRFCYDTADTIISLFEAYQKQQIFYGAPKDKTRIIFNGVDTDHSLRTTKKIPNTKTPVIAFIGRVVPIKDVKTFIRACVAVLTTFPEGQAWIIGPTDEDVHYFHQCQDLINVLNLSDRIIFKGKQFVPDILKNIDVLVLSSISEGLPLVMLEAFAAGIPVVSTNVGACQELIEGAMDSDRALGKAGLIVNIANASELSEAIIELLNNTAFWQSCQKAALARVTTYYTTELFKQHYQAVYQEVMTTWPESVLN